MQKILLLFFSLISLSGFSQSTCLSALPAFSNDTTFFNAPVSTGPAESGPDYGCIGSAQNPYWLYIKICSGGPLSFTINGGSSNDIDIAVWGPFNTLAECPASNQAPISCSYSTSNTESFSLTSSNAGEYYKILVLNFDNQPGVIKMYKSGGVAIADSSCVDTSITYQHQFCSINSDDTLTGISLDWEWDTLQGTSHYFLMRKNLNTGSNQIIDTLFPTDASVISDTFVNNSTSQYSYSLVRVDTAGIPSTGSNGTTNYLYSNDSYYDQYVQLLFSASNTNTTSPVFIFRGNSSVSLVPYDTLVAGTTAFFDTLPPYSANYFYRFAITNADPCDTSLLEYSNIIEYDYCHYIYNNPICMSTYDNNLGKYILFSQQNSDTTLFCRITGNGGNPLLYYNTLLPVMTMSNYPFVSSSYNYLTVDLYSDCPYDTTVTIRNVELLNLSSTFTDVTLNFSIPPLYSDNLELVIFRGATIATLSPYDTILPPYSSYVDVNPIQGGSFYRIGLTYAINCDTSGNYPLSMSHIWSAYVSPIGIESVVDISMQIFPNPANDEVQILLNPTEGGGELIVRSITGQLIYFTRISTGGNIVLTTSDWANGSYIVSVNQGEKIFHGRILIAH